MILNDWKKLRGIKHRWESNDDQVDIGERRKNEWSVVSIYGKFDDKYFDSESKALKWAKNYMKTH